MELLRRLEERVLLQHAAGGPQQPQKEFISPESKKAQVSIMSAEPTINVHNVSKFLNQLVQAGKQPADEDAEDEDGTVADRNRLKEQSLQLIREKVHILFSISAPPDLCCAASAAGSPLKLF